MSKEDLASSAKKPVNVNTDLVMKKAGNATALPAISAPNATSLVLQIVMEKIVQRFVRVKTAGLVTSLDSANVQLALLVFNVSKSVQRVDTDLGARKSANALTRLTAIRKRGNVYAVWGTPERPATSPVLKGNTG